MSKPQSSRWFKSGKVNFKNAKSVNHESGVIEGVILCQVGEAKGHGVHLEQEFIDSGIAYAQKYHAEKGMKARFGHPNMSTETLGSEMGRFKNFRVEADKMIADLNLFESANLSPTKPKMKDWMLSMADEDPEAIMCSIVFSIGQHYQRNDEGEKYVVEYHQRDYSGEWLAKDKKERYDPDRKIFVTLKELMFTDIVDQGAATDKLFSEQFNSTKFSVIATQFFNENPQLDDFIKENPTKIFQFLSQRFGIEDEPEQGTIDKFLSLFSNKNKNQNKFYMSKVQLSKLAELAVKLSANEASPEDYAAVQTELQEQGVDVVILGSAQHTTSLNRTNDFLDQLKKSFKALGQEYTVGVSLGDNITNELAGKDKIIADLTKKLGLKSDPPKKPKSDDQQEFDEDEEENNFSSSVDQELKAMKSKLQ